MEDIANAWDPRFQFGDQPNQKTIGVLLYSAAEKEMFKDDLETRANKYVPVKVPMPKNTKLARDRAKEVFKIEAAKQQHEDLVAAMTAFLNLIAKHIDVKEAMIPKDVLERVLDKDGDVLTKEQKDLLFGEGKSSSDIVNAMDTDNDGQIHARELTKYAESRGIDIRNIFRGFGRTEIKNLKGYFSAILDMLMLNSKRVFFERFDLQRTIGVNTGYLGTLDLEMEEEDRNYMLQQGKRGCMAFLLEYQVNNKERIPLV